MDKLVITGGKKLQGEVHVSGAKNAALPIIAASILADSPCIIHNVPDLVDVHVMCDLLRTLGIIVAKRTRNTLVIDPSSVKNYEAPYDLVRKMRASICVLGALVGRLGKAKISMPGGCVIGPRPINLHIKGMSSLGVSVKIEHGYVVAHSKKLKGAEVFLGGRYGSSVLATANVIMAATGAKGTTVIENASCEPEIIDLVSFINAMGGDVHGAGSPRIMVYGTKSLHGCEHSVIPDRIEAGTYILSGIITRGAVTVSQVRPDHCKALLDTLSRIGVGIKTTKKSISITNRKKLKTIDLVTAPYPGFPTDLQAQFMVLMSVLHGLSVITEKVFPERFMHIAELNRMAADIALEGNTAIIKGGRRLSGAPVMASDLRASAALVLAGLAAEGTTTINRIYHLDRGYEDLECKLTKLGADVKRIKE